MRFPKTHLINQNSHQLVFVRRTGNGLDADPVPPQEIDPPRPKQFDAIAAWLEQRRGRVVMPAHDLFDSNLEKSFSARWGDA